MLLLNSTYEQEIITMLLASDESMQNVILQSLSTRMFTNAFYRKIFEVCEHLNQSKHEINVFSVTEILNQNAEELMDLQNNFITNINYQYYVKKIQENYFNNLTASAKNVDDIDYIQREREKYTDTSCMQSISYNAKKILTEDYENQTIVKTGFKKIDDNIGCFQKGDYVILAGITGSGKTGTMLNIARNISSVIPCNIYSLEMTKNQLINRIVCSVTELNAGKFRTKSLHPYEYDKYMNFLTYQLPELKLNICTSYDVTIDKIYNIEKKSESEVVFIDYLGLVGGYENKPTYERMSDISRKIKMMALETNKLFFVLHQLNRDYANRQDKTPRLSDLRDSGKIAQDADYVCFVHRPALFEPHIYKESELQFLVGKARYGACNRRIDLIYDGRCQSIKE